MGRRAKHLAGLAGAALVAAAGLAGAFPALAQGDAEIDLGRRIFLDGVNARGEPIRALVGAASTPVTGAAVACGNCHGRDGRGRPEGGVVPTDIRWEELTKPYGHVRAGGRVYGPFDERSFARAVTEGLDPAGQRIDPSMPRFSLSVSEAKALAAYLQRLSDERDPGIEETTLRLGTILPAAGTGASSADAIRAVLEAAVADLNERGGIHGRRVELVVAPDLASAAARFGERPVFALVSPFAIGSEAAMGRFAERERIGIVAPFTLAAGADAPLQVFYLYPGIADLARVLLDFAGRESALKTQRVVAFVDEADAAVGDALRAQCRRRDCAGFELLPLRSASEPGAVARIAHLGVQVVVFAGADRELTTLLGFAQTLNWHPTIYAPGSAAARAMFGAPSGFDGRLFVALPVRADLQADSPAAAAFERLRTRHKLGAAHAAAQGFAYAAISIAIEGLRQAGRELSRERFVRALEGLRRFDAGPTPPVSYGPGRRIGAFGGYVVAVDPRKGFRPVSDWIGLEPL